MMRIHSNLLTLWHALMTGTDRNEFPPPSACTASDHLMSQLHLQSELPLQFRTGCMPHTNTPSTVLIPPLASLACVLGHLSTTPDQPPTFSTAPLFPFLPTHHYKVRRVFQVPRGVCLFVCFGCSGYCPLDVIGIISIAIIISIFLIIYAADFFTFF